MPNNFTYRRFQRMILDSYLIDYGVDKHSERMHKHLYLLGLYYDPSDFTDQTINDYRVALFTKLNLLIERWDNRSQLGG